MKTYQIKTSVFIFLFFGYCFFVFGDLCASKTSGINTFFYAAESLRNNKQLYSSGDKKTTLLIDDLKASAEKILEKKPYSVTEKKVVPPSGDKRDYMSVGPYWWPNPDTSDGLPYIRKDGQVNPERFDIPDAEYFKDLCRDVPLLSLANYFTNDEKFGNKATLFIRTWFVDPKTRMNPHLNYGQAIPGITEGRGIGLIDTRSLVYLIDGIQILQATGHISDSDYLAIQNWFKQFLDWMLTSPIGLDEADEHNNHGTYYDVQTISIALFLNNKELAKKMVEEKSKLRIETQLEVNGSQPHELARTLSWGYSLMNLSGFFEVARLAENVDIDLWNFVTPGGKSLKKAFFWMLPYANGKEWTHKQIKAFNTDSFVPVAKTASAHYDDPELKVYLNNHNDYKLSTISIITN